MTATLNTTKGAGTNPKYSHLAQPIKIGNVTVKNRFMKNGTGFFWDDPETGSYVNQKYLDYFETLAAGGAGLIATAMGPLTRDLDAKMPGYRITDDRYIPGWKEWADTVHRHGAAAFGQLFHLGPMAPLLVNVPPSSSASAIPREESPRPGFGDFRAHTVEEIEDIIQMFIEAAERQKKAGLDGTELNVACNHFVNNFLSRAWNRREDEWGAQNMENRTRVAVRIIRGIKERNGEDWPIIVLMNAIEVDLKDGITIDESKEFAKIFVEAGADALEVRGEYYTWTQDTERRESLHFPDMYLYPHRTGPIDPYVDASRMGKGANIPMAAEIKAHVDVPVITVGRLDWDIAEKSIGEGKFDIASMNRRMLADPGLPNKVLTGDVRDINPCAGCMTCFDSIEHFGAVKCRVNASLGREREYAITPAPVKKKVLVIGGGPSGMEAARVAALRGHAVVLYEKLHKLGGSLPVAALVKGPREDIAGMIKYLDRQVHKAGVTVHLGKAVTKAILDKEAPDEIIVAAGGTHEIPDIPGIDGRNVMTGQDLHTLAKGMLQFVPIEAARTMHHLPVARSMMIGNHVVVMGGQLHGCQTAEYLLSLGKKVTIVHRESREDLGEGLLEVFMKPYLLWWLEEQGVEFITDATFEKVTKEGLQISTPEGGRRLIKADTVMTALALQPNPEIVRLAEETGASVHVVGDAGHPALMVDAVASGAAVGHEI